MSRTVTPTGSRRPEFNSLEERLWWSRESAHLTQQQIADQLGISRKTVQNYEAGVGYPKENRLVLWANACDVDFSWLAADFYARPAERSEVGRRGVHSNRVSTGSNRG
jgi:transcriptional regulator with XRE-family HTH domain